MKLYERTLNIPRIEGGRGLLGRFARMVSERLSVNERAVRFVVESTSPDAYHCEVGLLSSDSEPPAIPSIFEFRKRSLENSERFNAALVIPTGMHAEIGGHAGDAAPVARLIASVCDTLVTHPNVVNGSDINEIPDNCALCRGQQLCPAPDGDGRAAEETVQPCSASSSTTRRSRLHQRGDQRLQRGPSLLRTRSARGCGTRTRR